MDTIKNFRKINEKEKKIIINSLREISPKLLSTFKEFEFNIYFSLIELKKFNKFPEIFLILGENNKIIKNPEIKNITCSAGLFLGYIKKGKFFVSLESVEFLYKKGKFSAFNQLYVNSKGEKAVLYGNDITKNMILKMPSNFKKNDFMIIFNASKEIIAIAKAQVNYDNIKNLKSKSKIAYNLVDKGYYLRKKQ
jgi:ribosome biogenesis protein Nip4